MVCLDDIENKKYLEFTKIQKDDLNGVVDRYAQGRIGSPNFGGIFFQGAPKKNCCQKKKIIK
jgi:hypothetical protein